MARAHLRIPHVFLDSGIISAIGINTFSVYCVIRRFVRTESSYHPRVEALRKEGWLVAHANQTKIALLTGLSRSSVTRAIGALKQVGWIQDRRLKDNKRAYIVGCRSEPDENGRCTDLYLADHWLDRKLNTLPPKLRRGWNEEIAQRRDVLAKMLQRVIDGDEKVI